MSSRLAFARNLQRSVERAGGHVSNHLELFGKSISNEIHSSDFNIGFRAAKEIQPFQCLMSIPLDLCFSESTITQKEETASQKLLQTLLKKKKFYSQFTATSPLSSSSSSMQSVVHSHYLNSLPGDADMFSIFPSNWSEDMWRGITNSTLYYLNKKNKIQFEQNYELLGNEFSLSDFVWAYNVVSSRSYGQGNAKALVPLLDLVNHSDDINAMPLGTKGCIVVRAPGIQHAEAYHLFSLAHIKQGEEICISYGELSAVMSLTGYGFLSRRKTFINDEKSSQLLRRDTALSSSGAADTVKYGDVFQLALPILPKVSPRGKISYTYDVFQFDEKHIDEGIEELFKIGLRRDMLTSAVTRRLKIVKKMLNDLSLSEAPSSFCSAEEEAEHRRHHEIKIYISSSELFYLNKMNDFLATYDNFLHKREQILEQRLRDQTEECKHVLSFAHLFKENTGLDIKNELFEDSPFDDDESGVLF